MSYLETLLYITLICFVTCVLSGKAQDRKRASAPRVQNICQLRAKLIKCPPGEVIYILHGYYGREDQTTCITDGSSPELCTPEPASYQKIWTTCEGRNKCRLAAKDSFMGSRNCRPARNYKNYIRVTYVCDTAGLSGIGSCDAPFAWAKWVNADTPDEAGDEESFSTHLQLKGACKAPKAIEVRLSNGDDYHESGNVLDIGRTSGAICINDRQSGGNCADYKVRYCCPKKKKPKRCDHPGLIDKGSSEPSQKYIRQGNSVLYSCNPPFVLDGEAELTCQRGNTWSAPVPKCIEEEVEKCTSESCDINASCTETDQGISCSCNAGFSGDGLTCVELDKTCNGMTCGVDAECKEIKGAKRCACAMGYAGDGFTCDPICTAPMVFSTCVSPCRHTCSEFPDWSCFFLCVHGCTCPDGMILNDDGVTCINPADCPGAER